MLVFKQQLQAHQLTQSAAANAAGISAAALAQIVNHNIWPRQNAEVIKQRITDFLTSKGIDTVKSFEVVQTTNPLDVCTDNKETTLISEEENMLLKKQVLFPATKKHFSLFRDPFEDSAIQSAEDVFMTPDSRYVREAMYQTARYGGFLAISGESGSGKTTLRRDLIDRINRENTPIIVIEPYVLAMEDNDVKGKTLKASSIAEAIVNTLAPLENLKRSPEARFRQLHRILKDSSRAGYQHVLIIEEAHSLPLPTLKHLKRFFELEDGFKKLLSIILVGQPELELKLSERNQEVREVVQRCEVVNLRPLNDYLESFLDFKFGRVGMETNKILDNSAIAAIRDRLCLSRHGGRETVSLLYPLAIGNLVTAAMNMAAINEIPTVDANIIRSVN
ncbi:MULTISPECIES: ExeA family protein [Xenorhabdus]|uniref:MSHA biogenesis protein MshM n=2 Tax=Xenorhabdus TaxID=626 RepID=A0A2D0IS09_9GAMM|nr:MULTISPECIES: AAA family ATPase [Xenorhabdus]OKP07283.1 MSHA biogenesis protein MshM [Xenorhabdus thuongxuanensis]PHM24610.1 MSHA biogenesis protein MshM [Xenorhabdus ehlersii]RKE91249.1 type II secretory pathway predicted ATPase ExeA [Xenorhabdus ehlersii]